MNDLKGLVHEIMEKGVDNIDTEHAANKLLEKSNFESQSNSPHTIEIKNNNIEDTEEFVEESLSLVDKEMELIKKALDKYKGKRKNAADELGISERTLYRKIKEYDIQ
jgi:transcriptional regulator with PAS, ATPase and Fis domain